MPTSGLLLNENTQCMHNIMGGEQKLGAWEIQYYEYQVETDLTTTKKPGQSK